MRIPKNEFFVVNRLAGAYTVHATVGPGRDVGNIWPSLKPFLCGPSWPLDDRQLGSVKGSLFFKGEIIVSWALDDPQLWSIKGVLKGS